MSFLVGGQGDGDGSAAQTGRRSTFSAAGLPAMTAQPSSARRSSFSTSGRSAARDALMQYPGGGGGGRNPASLTRDAFGGAFTSGSLRRGMTPRGAVNPRAAEVVGQPMLFSQMLWSQSDNGAVAEQRTPPSTSGNVTPSSGGDSGTASCDNLLDMRALRYFEQDDAQDAGLEDEEWVKGGEDRGFVRVHAADGSYSAPFRCTLQTTCRELADKIGTRWLFVQECDSLVRRLLPTEKPLFVQQQLLGQIGYDGYRQQLQGMHAETGQLVRFFDGK